MNDDLNDEGDETPQFDPKYQVRNPYNNYQTSTHDDENLHYYNTNDPFNSFELSNGSEIIQVQTILEPANPENDSKEQANPFQQSDTFQIKHMLSVGLQQAKKNDPKLIESEQSIREEDESAEQSKHQEGNDLSRSSRSSSSKDENSLIRPSTIHIQTETDQTGMNYLNTSPFKQSPNKTGRAGTDQTHEQSQNQIPSTESPNKSKNPSPPQPQTQARTPIKIPRINIEQIDRSHEAENKPENKAAPTGIGGHLRDFLAKNKQPYEEIKVRIDEDGVNDLDDPIGYAKSSNEMFNVAMKSKQLLKNIRKTKNPSDEGDEYPDTNNKKSNLLIAKSGTFLTNYVLSMGSDEGELDMNLENVKKNENLQEFQDQDLSEEEEKKKQQEEEKDEDSMIEEQINEQDIVKEILKEPDNQEENVDDPFSSNFFNIFNFILSFLFMIMIMTECDFSSQQKVGTILTNMFDQTAYDSDGNTRMSIAKPSEIYKYLNEYMIPTMYNEPAKKARSNPYILDVQYLRSLLNETKHYLNDFNFLVGIQFGLKKIYWQNNTDETTNKAIPQIIPEAFDVDSVHYPDNQDPLKVAGSSKVYYYNPDGGQSGTGAFVDIIVGNETYAGAQQKIKDMYNAGWFDDDMLYFSCELMTYNINYHHAGFFSFYHYLDMTGTMQTNSGRFITLYPNSYDNLQDPGVLFRIFVFSAYSLCLSLGIIRFIMVCVYYVRQFIIRKQWTMPWYYYLDIIIFALSSQCLYYWFQNLALRGTFALPFSGEREFNLWTSNLKHIRNFLQISPIAILFLCIKNIQIISVYFPAYGVLFDTISKMKQEAISFFILSIVLGLGFIFAGILFFGSWINSYTTVLNSTMSLFFIIMTQAQTSYSDLQDANYIAPIFFFPVVVMFQIILINIFLSMIIKKYDGIRKQKQLQSEAIALMFRKNYQWKFHLWTNFMLCKLDRRTKDELFIEQEKQNKLKKKEVIGGKINKKKKSVEKSRVSNDIKTIFLYNKVQLFGQNEIQTKEGIEQEIFENKKKIIKNAKVDVLRWLSKFKSGDKKLYIEFKKSFIYIIYIINFVTCILMQLDITTLSFATNPIRSYMEGGKFSAEDSSSSRLLNQNSSHYDYYNSSQIDQYLDDFNLTNDYDNDFLIKRNLQSSDGSSGQVSDDLKSNLYDLYSVADIQNWLNLKFYRNLYYNTKNTNQFIAHNYFIGEQRMRLTLRRIKMMQNTISSQNSTITKVRDGQSFSFDSDTQANEHTSSFKGNKSKYTYEYFHEGSMNTYGKKGGYVVYFKNTTKQALQVIRNLYSDLVLDGTFNSMIIEISTYNPNFKVFILSQVIFEYTNSGLVEPTSQTRAIRTNFYQTRSDYFRAFLELVFVVYVAIQNCQIIKSYLLLWRHVYIKDLIKQRKDLPENAECLDIYFFHMGIDYDYFAKKWNFFIFLLAQVLFILKWLLNCIIRTLRVALSFIKRDGYELLNLILTITSDILIVYWIKIMIYESLQYDQLGMVINKGTYLHQQIIGDEQLSYIDIYSYISYLFRTYNLVASLNSMLTFFRIFEFFKFSIKLSVFTQILKVSKNDILYFLIMFGIFLLGFAIMGNTLYGENLAQYSDMSMSIIQLFKFMVTFFTYSDFSEYSDLSPFFFITFMVLFTMFLLNMLIAIIIAHYSEYNKMIQELHQSNIKEEEEVSFFKLVFQVIKTGSAPRRYKRSQHKIQRIWYQCWQGLDRFLNKPNQENIDLQEQIQVLRSLLSTKYTAPDYNGKLTHRYLQPYLYDNDQRLNSLEEENDNQEKEQNRVSNIILQRYMAHPEARNFKQLKVGVFSEDKMDTEQLTTPVTWQNALEDELFAVSNFQLYFTDLLEQEDRLYKSEIYKFHEVKDFNSYQSSFLAQDFEVQIEMWKQGNPVQKFKIWEILDFQKVIEDQNSIYTEENLENLIEFMNACNKGQAEKLTKPIISFKKINRSPEYTLEEYSKASNFQRQLWLEHTSQHEKFQLWFNCFSPYYRSKLWNVLKFSEDYAMYIANSKEFMRKDLINFVTKTLSGIRQEVVTHLEKQIEKLKIERTQSIALFSKVETYTYLIKKIEELEKKVEEYKSRKIKLSEILRVAPNEVRQKFILSDFYLKVWEIMKEREYEETVPNPEYHRFLIMSIMKTKLKQELQDKFEEEEKKKRAHLTGGSAVIDQYDEEIQEEHKSLEIKKRAVSQKPITQNQRQDPFQRYGTSIKEIMTEAVSDTERSPRSRPLPTLGSVKDDPFGVPIPTLGSLNSEGPQVRFNTRLAFLETEEGLATDRALRSPQLLMTSPRSPIGFNFKKKKDDKNPPQKEKQSEPLKEQQSSKLGELQKMLQHTMKRKFQPPQTIQKKIKIDEGIHARSIKRLFQLMIHGPDGQRFKTINKDCEERIEKLLYNKKLLYDSHRDEKIHKFRLYYKHFTLLEHMDEREERLALWLPLPFEEKLKLIAAEHLQGESELMTMLLLEEIDWNDKGIYKLNNLETVFERGLDNLIYEKYQNLTEIQANDIIHSRIQDSMNHLLEEDQSLLSYINFLVKKFKLMGETTYTGSKTLSRLYDNNRRIEERIKWKREDNLLLMKEKKTEGNEDQSTPGKEPSPGKNHARRGKSNKNVQNSTSFKNEQRSRIIDKKE